MQSGRKESNNFSNNKSKKVQEGTLITEHSPFTTEGTYNYLTDSIYNIDTKSYKSYLAKTKDYEHYEHSILKIKTREFDNKGNLLVEKDTSFNCGSTTSSSNGIEFGNIKRFYAESETVSEMKIISEDGDLKIKGKNSETLLLKFNGHFDAKFGSGYYNPTLSSDGKKTAFQYLAGFLKNGSCIYEMDIKEKSKVKLVGEDFFKPKYSPDSKFLLLFANSRESKNKTWINDIYVLDIERKNKNKVAKGDNYLWLPN
jgi:hypothetical protein